MQTQLRHCKIQSDQGLLRLPFILQLLDISKGTLEPHYMTDLRWFKGGPQSVVSKQKCIDYTEKLPFMVMFLYNYSHALVMGIL